MLLYLLDTNVISELRKSRPHGAVMTWVRSVPHGSLAIAAATVGELQAGIELTLRQDKRKAEELESWLDWVLASYPSLPADDRVFREWARIIQRRPRELEMDLLLAATASVYELTIVTRNTRHFQDLKLNVVNPFLHRA
jgi:predicted nucleic acid-binding protein